MNQNVLNRQVCKKTGESIRTIQRIGFSPLVAVIPLEERGKPLVIDWDLEQSTKVQGSYF